MEDRQQLLADPLRHRWAIRERVYAKALDPQEATAIAYALVHADPGAFWREICHLLWEQVPPGEAADTFGTIQYLLQTEHPTFVPYLLRVQARQLLEAGPDLRYSLLRRVDLGHQELTPVHLEQLAHHRCFRAIEELSLRHTGLPPEAFDVLFGASFWHLRRLDLSYNGLGLEQHRALVGSPCFGQLTHLDLTCTGLRGAGVGVLASSASERLCVLILEHNRPGWGGVAALSRADWPALRRLELGDAWLGVVEAAKPDPNVEGASYEVGCAQIRAQLGGFPLVHWAALP